ncbi:hypothetical protein AB205_0039360 [Aquarana catesbeiana]|uniref:Uncharacterized protein n=1 Tax=Aquarana catesbeiana TaxID=8400 RepID=A0A2G9QCN1_AQUCT|nr:hypothetical protein AB205_0039360 [Aquarana catesbeiana]
MLSKGFGDGDHKSSSTTGSQFLEQFKTAQALAQLAAQHSQSDAPGNNTWDLSAAAQPPSLGQFATRFVLWLANHRSQEPLRSIQQAAGVPTDFRHDGGIPSGESAGDEHTIRGAGVPFLASNRQEQPPHADVPGVIGEPVGKSPTYPPKDEGSEKEGLPHV